VPGFTVMTWNVENLFRLQPNASEDDEAVYAAKLTLLSEVIGRHDPDVVALQEVGGAEPLADLQAALMGAYPHATVSLFPDGRGIRVACLSKLAPDDRQDFADFPAGAVFSMGAGTPVTRMGRGALKVRVTKEGVAVDVMTVHLKSKLLSFPRPWGTSFTPRNEQERAQVAGLALMRRAAEAVTVRIRANQLIEGNDQVRLILLGDMNDVPEAQTSLILTGPPGSEIGTLGFDRPDQGDDARLFSLAPLMPEGQNFSRVHHGVGELLDQILASDTLLPIEANGDRRLPAVLSDVDFADGLLSVSENPNLRAAEVAPDHAPVVATFQI